jgi:hypothetical protein
MAAHRMWKLIALLVFATFSESAVALPSSRIIQPAQVLLIAEDAPKQEPGATTENTQDLATQSLEACMKNWDPGTHMSKDAWRQSCKRITEERLPYVKVRSQFADTVVHRLAGWPVRLANYQHVPATRNATNCRTRLVSKRR